MKHFSILLQGIVFLCFSFSAIAQTDRIALQGSSTANGYGVPDDSSLAGRLKRYYQQLGRIDTLYKIAVSAASCYEGMPTGYVPPPGRPAPDSNYNITRVMSRNPRPTIVIVNYPSNGYDYMSIPEILDCLQTIRFTAESQGARCYITSTQPRDGFTSTDRQKLRVIRDSIMARFGAYAIDFFTPVVSSSNNTIRPEYAYGDGIHLNAAGHRVLFEQVLAAGILDNTVPPPAISAGADIVQTFTAPFINVNIPVQAKQLQAGLYTISVKMTDSLGTEYRDTSLLRVLPAPNQLPVVNAGTDRSLTLPADSLTLQGTAGDPDGSIVSWLWTQASGPAGAIISSPDAASTLVSGLVQGIYSFRLTVSDNNGGMASDIVQVTVNAVPPPGNQLPLVNAGPDQSVQLPVNSISLSGTATDADGTISSVSWSRVSGPTVFTIQSPSSLQTQVTGLVAGTYLFRLAATDNNGGTGADTVIILVLPVNPPPPPAGVQRVLIDAGMSNTTTASPDQWGKYWNNMTDARAGLRVNNAIDVTNVPTTLKLEVIRPVGSTASYDNNMRAGDGIPAVGGQYPVSATNDHTLAHISVTNGEWRFYDLDPARTYTIKFWGSRNSSGSRFMQIKRTDEIVWKEFNVSLNTNYDSAAYFTFSGRSEMSFNFRVKSGSTFSYINVIDISSVPAQTTARGNFTPVAEEKGMPDLSLLRLQPNPGTDQVQLYWPDNRSAKLEVEFRGAGGELIRKEWLIKEKWFWNHVFPTRDMAAGLYFITVRVNGEQRTFRWVKM
ncbi:MAG: hypothetical protein HZA79_05995 [Sphingobacteriales bacterium]|nr:hypothetical protein [Sphingobacteriales bacterium]